MVYVEDLQEDFGTKLESVEEADLLGGAWQVAGIWLIREGVAEELAAVDLYFVVLWTAFTWI